MSVSTDSIGNEGKLSIIALFQKNLRFRFFPTQILRKKHLFVSYAQSKILCFKGQAGY